MTDTSPPSFLTPVALSFPPAERLGARVDYFHYLPHQKLYVVNVCFIGAQPEQAVIDHTLRECTALAAALDGRFNIFADAYLLPDAGTDADRRLTLAPYGRDHFLCFDAALRQIGVRRNGKKHFEPKLAITPVGVVGAGDNAHHPERDPNPVYEGPGMEEEVDDPTDSMRGLVSEWIWYGYSTAESINRWIDENHAAGDGFDLAWIKTFAADMLARKRAAEARWPEETDNDRLDRAFARLNEQGICAVHWAGHDISEGVEAVREAIDEAEEAGTPREHFWGVCFFHSQDMDSALQGEGLRLAFGVLDNDDDEPAIRVGQTICEVLAQEGLTPQWNGTVERRIELPDFRWQRRTPD